MDCQWEFRTGDQSSGPVQGCCIMVITEAGTPLTVTCYLTCTYVCQSCVKQVFEDVQGVREVFGKLVSLRLCTSYVVPDHNPTSFKLFYYCRYVQVFTGVPLATLQHAAGVA